MTWCSEAYQYLLEGQYNKVVSVYEDAVKNEPEVLSNALYLGLAYLLESQEEEARATWLWAISQGNDTENEAWTNNLVEILEIEARRQENVENLQNTWLIRQQIQEINPSSIDNILRLILVSIELNQFNSQSIKEYNAIEILKTSSIADLSLLSQVLIKVIEFSDQNSLDFAEVCAFCFEDKKEFVSLIYPIIRKTAYQSRLLYYAVALAELCLRIHPSHFQISKELSRFYLELEEYSKAIDSAKNTYNLSNDLFSQLISNGTLLAILMRSGAWQTIPEIIERQKKLLNDFSKINEYEVSLETCREIFVQTSLLFYQQDGLTENRYFQNTTADLFEKKVKAVFSEFCDLNISKKSYLKRRIKIGYIAHTFRAHSVGWLCRSIFQYHDRESFEVGIYFVNQNQVNQNLDNPFFQTWFSPHIDYSRSLGNDALAIAQQIRLDGVDILIDLDSTTMDLTCTVMALKPAPIQVTWLGFDAPSLSAIDYFIADPYVLPSNAQEHYPEKIWRLPSTYVAVDGFEVDVPTLRREDLEIPPDAITFLSAQSGMKRHPDTIRLQMRIVKEVSNSFFLIKGLSDEMLTQSFFTQIATEESLDPARLRFLARDPNEYVHRANLQIADVVLDTYPYNGATTTLETLWMGIPVVTRVGEQFAARNSYTFLINAGVTEGIAWTDKEYVEWGIRFGCDANLRQQVAWKLKASKHRSPLWNPKQFTQDMEHAYRQMWASYIKKQ